MIWVFWQIERLNMNSMYGQHALYQIYTMLGLSIGVMEMRYMLQRLPAPRLTWFYQAYYEHEYAQIILNWHDNIGEAQRKFLTISKEQIDYYNIHKEFVYIKKRALSNYLENEKKNLDKHFHDRTLNILKTIEKVENSNITNKIREIAEESLKTVLNRINTDDEIINSSFESALVGLRKGQMAYEGDQLLPMFLKELKSRTQVLQNLTPEE